MILNVHQSVSMDVPISKGLIITAIYIDLNLIIAIKISITATNDNNTVARSQKSVYFHLSQNYLLKCRKIKTTSIDKISRTALM